MDRNFNSNECISNVVNSLKSKGSFDQFRRECLADVDTKPSYRNLLQRVEGYVKNFLYKQNWSSTLNKAQLRNRLRNEINESDMLKNGIHHLVDQVVNDKVRTEFKDKIEQSLKDYLGIKDEPEEAPVVVKQQEQQSTNIEDEKHAEDHKEASCDINRIDVKPFLVEKEKMEQISDEEDFDKISNDWSTPPKSESTPEKKTDDHEAEGEAECEQVQPSNTLESTIEHNDDASASADMDICAESREEVKVDDEETADQATVDKDDQPDMTEQKSDNENLEPIESNASSVEEGLTSSEVHCEPTAKDAADKEEMSDISSVHTSDLSDFDDEISLSSDDENEVSTKRKISLKAVKELTASISEVKHVTPNEDSHEQESRVKSARSSDTEEFREEKSTSKRKRKINPKFESYDNFYKKTKRSKAENVESVVKQQAVKDGANTRQSLKRKRASESTDKSEEKVAKTSVLRARKTSEPTVSSVEKPPEKRGRGRPRKYPLPDQANNKRYDSSDLYKPRNSLATTSRRTRSTLDLDSNSNSTTDETESAK